MSPIRRQIIIIKKKREEKNRETPLILWAGGKNKLYWFWQISIVYSFVVITRNGNAIKYSYSAPVDWISYSDGKRDGNLENPFNSPSTYFRCLCCPSIYYV